MSMKAALERAIELLHEDDIGDLADIIVNMRPDEYAEFRRRMLLGRGVAEKSYRQLLDLLGLREMIYATKKENKE